MDNVGESVPIRQVLGVFAAPDGAVPEFDTAAFTDDYPAKGVLAKGGD